MKRLALALGLSAVLLPALFLLRFDSRPATALPASSPEAKRFAQLAAFLGQRETVVLLLCGANQDAADAAFVAATKAWDFGDVLLGASLQDASDLVDQTLALWPADDYAGLAALFSGTAARVAELRAKGELIGGGALLRQAQLDPLGLGPELLRRLSASNTGMTVGADMRLRAGDCRVAFVMARLPSSDRVFVRALARAVSDARAQVEKVGGELYATGPHLFAAEYDQRLSQGLWRSGLLSILAVLLICYVLFRDLVAMVLIGVALAVASGWTLGAATLVLGELQILAVSAASILPAVGIDAGIQFYVHRRMVRAIYVAALASGLGFASLVFADTRAFRQFGVLLALGVAANTVAMATLLPALFRLAERLGWRPRPVRAGMVERAGAALGRLPKPLALALLLVAFVPLALLYAPPPRLLGFSALIDSTLDASKAQRVFERVFGASDRHVFIASEAPSEDEAIAAEKQLAGRLLAARPEGVTVEGGALLWVTEADRARAAVWRQQLAPAATADRLRSELQAADFEAHAFDVGLARLAALGSAEAKLPLLARLAYRQRVGPACDGHCYWALTSLFISANANGAEVLASLRGTLPASSHLVGPFALDLELRESLAQDGRLLSGLAVLAVIAALLLARMRVRRVLAVVSALGLIFALLWLSLGAFSLPLTLVTLLVVPFVLGIGIDASVYLAEHDDFTCDRRALLEHHLRPLLGSTLTTLVGFACLSFVDLEQIRLLGVCVALGLAWALWVALLWIPLFAPSRTVR